MKKTIYIGVLLCCLWSCKGKVEPFVLKASIPTLGSDTVLIYGNDGLFDRIDTVVAKNGTFVYTSAIDTVVPLWVNFPNQHRELVFADKHLTVTLKGDTAQAGHLKVRGGEANRLLAEFRLRTDSLSSRETLQLYADTFIRQHPYSEVSIYLLQHYFVWIPEPNMSQIKSLIASMSGNLQDNNYLIELKRDLESQKPLAVNNVLSNYAVRDSEGKMVSSADYKDTFLLLSFWASWDEESRARQNELKVLEGQFKKRNIQFLNVSLDVSEEQWRKAIQEDTLIGRHANDFKGWATPLVNRLNVTDLPANVLINPQRRVQAINLYGKALEDKIELLTETPSIPKLKYKR